ncbi:unnamed protein product [Debaryomyces tyrocola]|nr:unnamed protein product [Debaryomyces tyrocola]
MIRRQIQKEYYLKMVESSNVRLTKREVFGTDSVAQGGSSRTEDIEEFGLCLSVANIDAIGVRVKDGVSCSIRSYPNAHVEDANTV